MKLMMLCCFCLILFFQNCTRSGGTSSSTSEASSTPANSTNTSALIATSSSTCPMGWICPQTPFYTSQVGAWFEPWWAGQPGASATISWLNVSRYQPMVNGVGTYYNCGVISDVTAEFAAVKAAGIDYLILDDTNSILDVNGNSVKPWIQQNILLMYQQAAILPDAQRVPMAVAIGGNLMLSNSVDLQNRDANYVAAHYAAWTSAYFKWQGLPLLVNYNEFSRGLQTSAQGAAPVFAPTWTDAGEGWRFVTRNAADYIDAASGFFPATSTEGAHGWWGWTQTDSVANPEAMTVSPGADNIHRNAIGGCTGCNVHIDRLNGQRYIVQWVNAVRYNPKTVVISSWNEFSDETAIETAWPNASDSPMWTDTYGNAMPDLYVQITTGYTNLRTGLMPGWYYRDESNYDIYRVVNGTLVKQASSPVQRAVIVLPAHKLDAIVASQSL